MDRLPRDVAGERLHHDIVRLLDEHVPRSPQMVSVISNGPLIGEYDFMSGVFLIYTLSEQTTFLNALRVLHKIVFPVIILLLVVIQILF